MTAKEKIVYPVRVAVEDGEDHASADAETMTVIKDWTGRTLDVDEIVEALNAFGRGE